jgi:DNA-binding GntR family transcriptional regulator
MNNLEQLAALLAVAVGNLDPQDFDALAAAVARFKAADQAGGRDGWGSEFTTLFGAIERAVGNT